MLCKSTSVSDRSRREVVLLLRAATISNCWHAMIARTTASSSFLRRCSLAQHNRAHPDVNDFTHTGCTRLTFSRVGAGGGRRGQKQELCPHGRFCFARRGSLPGHLPRPAEWCQPASDRRAIRSLQEHSECHP